MGRKGFTLIELTIAIVVVAIAFYAIISVFSSVAPRNVSAEDLSKATYLANRVLEERSAKSFSGITSEAATNFASPYANFIYQVTVTYASTAEPDNISASATILKKLSVRCWGGMSGTIEVITLVATYGL
jgi:prepilin-type N-terminal cleavage/methylation domain-containing protein